MREICARDRREERKRREKNIVSGWREVRQEEKGSGM